MWTGYRRKGGGKMDAISCICFVICVIAGSFIGHMLYDISKAHKTHKGNEK